ncbi:MAG: YtxH domain-containing protein [Acidobacteria bacterium]|nr:YtxH domain-containing protein [Acidobacteriota bacterium]
MDDDKRLSYFFLGLGLGVAVGMLFAPKSGEETREILKQKADEGADFLKRRGEELRETASEYVDRGRTVLSRQRDNISAAMDAGKAAYREAVTSPDTARSASAGGAEGI